MAAQTLLSRLQTKGFATLMAVMMPREKWTDQRLDDLNAKVDGGFKRMDEGFAKADKKVDAGFARVDADIRELRGEMRGLQRALFAASAVIIAAMIGTNAL